MLRVVCTTVPSSSKMISQGSRVRGEGVPMIKPKIQIYPDIQQRVCFNIRIFQISKYSMYPNFPEIQTFQISKFSRYPKESSRRSVKMSGLHPQFMLSKRFPVHAAIELLDLHTLAKLLNEEARFHFGRKLTDSEVSMMAVMSYFIVVLVLGVSGVCSTDTK